MSRKWFLFAIILVNFMIALVALRLPVVAAPTLQTEPETVDALAEQVPLSQPLAIQVQQALPITLTINSEDEGAEPRIITVTLNLDLRLADTQTLASTVPATVTLSLGQGISETLPLSLLLGSSPTATLIVTSLTPLAAIDSTDGELTATENLTATGELTETAEISPTEEATATPSRTPTPTREPTETPTPTETATLTATTVLTPTPTALPAISSTSNVTANLRGGPGVNFEVVGQVGLGQPVTVLGVSADGQWLLLSNAQWINLGLVDNPPANPPVADEALIAQTQANATLTPPATTAPATTAPLTTTTAPTTGGTILLPTPTPTAEPIPPSVTANANLRSGPGTEFSQVGGTITGQTITIVARNEAGDWFQLDNGGWVASFLVANAPDPATIPIFDPNAPPPTAPLTSTVGTTATAGLTTTVPITEAETVTETVTETTPSTPVVLGVRDSLYLVDANEAIDRYGRALDQIDQLTGQAGQNEALLQDATWIRSITTAIALLQATDERVRGFQPTTAVQTIHTDLVAAADTFDQAAALLTQGIDERDPDLFDQAFAAITRGNTSLSRAERAIATLNP